MKDVTVMGDSIKSKIFTIRNVQVMFDSDLANLYGVSSKRLNEQVRRNRGRFPENFMFQLSQKEYESLRSQFATSKPQRGGRRYLPYVFTEQGVSMLSGVLKSKTAVEVSIQIMNAFVAMRKFILKNAEVFSRLDFIEREQMEFEIKTDRNFEKIFSAIEEHSFEKKQGIFFEGQIFDAYKFVSDIIRKADKSIYLIDNYVDDSVLMLFSKKKKSVKGIIYTKNVSSQLKLDVEKYNAQYGDVEVRQFDRSHDRFMIIDEKEVYHIGASLKDLGKKWFAFSKFDKSALGLLDRLK